MIAAQNDAIAGEAKASFPELAAPHLVLASPAGIETTTDHSTHIASIEHTALTTGRNLSFAVGDSLFASIAVTFRLFVKKAGMKLIAAAGKVSIQAQNDDIDLIANKVLTLISQTDWVDIRGKKGVRLHGADSMIEISDKIQFFTATPTLFHGNLETLGPQSRAHPAFDRSTSLTSDTEVFDEQFRLVGNDGVTPLANRRYRITASDGQIWEGVSDCNGLTARIKTVDATNISMELFSS